MSRSRRLQLPPGMTEGGRLITASVIPPIAPPVQAWMPALGADDVESTERSEDESRWHERVGHVQDQHQTVLKCPVAAPARQPNNVHAAAQKQQRAGRCIKRPGDPQRKHDGA